jgi:hypothetical protein
MPPPSIRTERPDLAAWRRRDDLRRGSRTSPIPNGHKKPARRTEKQRWMREAGR